MKSALTFMLMLAFAMANGQVVWEKTWGGPYDDGCEVRNTRDGGMVVMATSGIHSWLMRLDANGDTLWTRELRQPYDLCAVTETYDGGFLATGVTRYARRDLIAWKFDNRGDSLWLRIYPDTSYTEGSYSVFPQPDSTFLLTGYTSANGYDMLVIHIDSLGNALWRKTYGGMDFEGGTMAARTSDGGHILATTTGNANPFIHVIKIDALGDTVWTRNLVEAHGTGGPVPMVAADGKIWLIGWMDHVDYNNYIACLDASGNRLWSREYPGIGFESRTARGIIEDRFGGYSFSCSIDHAYGPAAGHDIALMRIDSLGNVTGMHRLGHPRDEMPRYFEQANNGDYLFLGFSSSFAPIGQQTYLARLNPAGCGEFYYDFDTIRIRSVCAGDTLLLDAGPGFASYLWSDGDSRQIRPILQTDTFFVQATDSLGCLHHSNAVWVEVQPLPSFTWQPIGNLGIQLDGTAAPGSTVFWTFGDGATGNTPDPTHIYAAAGDYVVCLSAALDSCTPVLVCDTVTVTSGVGLLNA
ncbi:MAG TPA: PKD domain-containing protein, partial [Bacteroidia bacterium]|nr:PKD domain-containing protein [Bacteroidia bacterium]